MRRISLVLLGVSLAVVLPAGCTAPASPPAQLAVNADPMVHCLLPSKVRKLGNLTYPARRQLVYEATNNCTLRGGEYTVYDRATAQASADFYRPLAEQGDAEAQYNLAMVYESLFNPPAYAESAKWYQSAAAQNHPDAQKNLAFLYEQGLGVGADKVKAVNLLRQAGGITDDLVLASELEAAKSAAQQEIQQLAAKLESQNAQTVDLQGQLAQANRAVNSRKGQLADNKAQLATLLAQMQDLEAKQAVATQQPANREETERLQAQVVESERLVAQQELTIASLEADVSAQRAQLQSSEKKAKLQETLLVQRVADAESAAQVASSATDALQRKDQELAALASQLETTRGKLQAEQAQQQTLIAQLQAAQQDTQQNTREDQAASHKMQALLAEVAQRDLVISQQTEEISALQQRSQSAQEDSKAEVQGLGTQLASLQYELGAQKTAYQSLQAQLQTGQQSASADAAKHLQRLAGAVAQREAVIAQQAAQVKTLQDQASRASRAIDALQTDNQRRVGELDLAHAKLVAAESELLQRQSLIADFREQLQSEQISRNALQESKARLLVQLQDSSGVARDVQALRQQLAASESSLQARDRTIAELNSKIAKSESTIQLAQDERNRLLAVRSPNPTYPTAPKMDLPPGNKYALLIGNDDYANLQPLTTARHGANEIADILKREYQFETTVLTNATKRQITDAFALLHSKLGPDDYVLIYYAGHGAVDPRDEAVSYWLPVDARADKMFLKGDGIESQWITSQLAAMQARHVMIIADSCYAGAMVRPPRVSSPRMTLDKRRLDYMLGRRSRTVLSSGENKPVLDQSLTGKHSVFTQALVEVLKQNPDIIYGEALHAALVELVRFNAGQLNFTQVPLFSEIAAAKHGNGQFVLKAVRG